MKSPTSQLLHRIDDRALAGEAAASLCARPAQVSPKFFYDTPGSRLFEASTELDEYSTARDEAVIFSTHGPAIARAALQSTGAGPVLVDLGAGNCAKAARLFGALQPRRYVAVDIAVDLMRAALLPLQREHPGFDLVGVGLDFSNRLQLPPGLVDGPALVFYPGSSNGNFAPDAAPRLLRQARDLAAGGALLEAAYDDALGVTGAFNLNLLHHLNRLLGSDFNPRGWRHQAQFNPGEPRVEMYPVARAVTIVRWPGGEREFAVGERMHTKSAYKWTPEAFAAQLQTAGFNRQRHWTDVLDRFAVFLAEG